MPLQPNAYTPDTIIIGTIAACRKLGVDDLAAVCAIACQKVESNHVMYANEGDPATLNFPYQALSRDKNSAGVYQQRYPWWDDPETDDAGGSSDRMDVFRSTKLFVNSLVKQRPNYHDNPGEAIANVQNCREDLRWKYGAEMDYAWAQFNRLKDVETHQPPVPVVLPQRPDFTELDRYGWGSNSRSRPAIDIFWHTEEGNSSAEQLAVYCDGSHNVSYHDTLRDGIVCHVVPPELYSWSVLDANVFSINICFAGSRVAMTREQWLERESDIEIAAYLSVQYARRFPTIDTRVIPPPYDFVGPGISDHKYVTQALGIGNHVDLGDNFIWDRARFYVDKYAGLTPQEDEMPLINGPSRSIYRSDNNDIGPGTEVEFQNNAMLHEHRVESLAIEGVSYERGLVDRTATGNSPVNDQLDDGARARAQRVLDYIAVKPVKAPAVLRKPKEK